MQCNTIQFHNIQYDTKHQAAHCPQILSSVIQVCSSSECYLIRSESIGVVIYVTGQTGMCKCRIKQRQSENEKQTNDRWRLLTAFQK